MVTWVDPFLTNAWVQCSMPKFAGNPELALGPRPPDTTLTRWLYDELRGAMLTGRLRRGMRLPAIRDVMKCEKEVLSERGIIQVASVTPLS
jgi:hypothetical protein